MIRKKLAMHNLILAGQAGTGKTFVLKEVARDLKFLEKRVAILCTTATSVWLIVVAGLWGATNPFIKQGSRGIEKVKSSTAVGQVFAELWFLATNWKYLLPFLINQSGSVLYYITLASADLSLAVPITNSLTFIFTSISGRLLGEKMPSKTTLIGMGLVIAGVLLCVMDKV